VGVAVALRPPWLPCLPRAAVLGAPLVALTGASVTGTVLAPALLTRSPLFLAALSPRSMFLVAAAAHAPLPLYLAVGLLRLFAAVPSHLAIGQTYGRNASNWLQQGPLPARITGRTTEWLFRRLGPIALVVSPTGKTVALASASDVPTLRITVSTAAGIVLKLALFYVLAHG